MAYTRSFIDFTPPRRFDETPFDRVSVEESAELEGTYAVLETVALEPLDDDPAAPVPRSFTVTSAVLERGWYRLRWQDADGGQALAEPVYFPEDWLPSLAQVGAQIRARTVNDVGKELGTFTAETRPTAEQVDKLIQTVAEEVLDVFAGTIPLSSYPAARRVIELEVAAQIEAAYFPEQTSTSDTTYPQLRALADNARRAMVNAANVRAAFKETAPLVTGWHSTWPSPTHV